MNARTKGLGALAAVVVVGAGAAAVGVGALTASAGAPAAKYDPPVNPAAFSTRIDNPYMPWKPGTVFRYRGRTGHARELDIVRVTHRTKRALGVKAVVVKDFSRLDGKPEELTYDYYAQDRSGNVWYFGEDSNDYHHGRWVRNDGSWLAGVGGAKPGIVMEAHPKAGDRYRQEFYRGHAEDRAKVLGAGGPISVAYGHFDRTLLTREHSALEPKVLERKYYARGIGDVNDVTTRGGTDHAQLVSIKRPR
jgi:hypothetical protein